MILFAVQMRFVEPNPYVYVIHAALPVLEPIVEIL